MKKAAINNAASPVVIIGLVLGCITIFCCCPFTAATVTCSGGQLSSGDALSTARDQLFTDLISNTFWNSYEQYCTHYPAAGTTSTMYGMANCATSKRCGPNYCSTVYEDCNHCLKTARYHLMLKCGDREGGFVEIVDDQQLQPCSLCWIRRFASDLMIFVVFLSCEIICYVVLATVSAAGGLVSVFWNKS
ncbi:unnamed protein product [Linum tenue]|uniref:Gnk2-homologous domain-containing protein n=1 Tax=Linum tenue TaxID=586396 RepID=A0AAV0KGI9_9ROSI|nr:unnamed protein product [Linum tenue]